MRIDRDVGCGVILRGAVSLAVSTSQVCLSHHSFLCQCLGFLVLQNFTILTVQAHLSFYFSCCDFMDVRITKNSFYLKASRHPSWWYVPRRENRINVSIGVKKKYNVWKTEIWLLKHGNPNSWKCHKSFIKQWMAKVATMWRYCVSLWRKTLPSRWASRSTTGTTTSRSCLLSTCSLLRYLWTCLVLDFLLVQIVIGPFTVAIWRGAWELYDDIFLVKLLYNLYTV